MSSWKVTKPLLLSFVPLELKGAGTSHLLNQIVSYLSGDPSIKLEVCTLATTEGFKRFSNWSYRTFRSLPIKFLSDVSLTFITYVLRRRKFYDSVLIVGCSFSTAVISALLRVFAPEVKVVQIPQLHETFIYRDKIASFLDKIKRWLVIYLINFKIAQPTLIVFSQKEESLVRPFVKRVIRKPLGIPEDRIKKLMKSSEERVKFCKSNVNREELVLLHVGDIHRNKFSLFALEVLRLLKKYMKNKVKLIAVGRIHERHYKKLLMKINEYKLNDVIKFKGVVEEKDLLEYWRKADMFVLFSRSEAGPFVVLEAMAAGLPVVATRIGIIPELEKKNAILGVDYDNAYEMALKIMKLWKDSSFRCALTKRAQEVVWEYKIENFLKLINDLIVTSFANGMYSNKVDQ